MKKNKLNEDPINGVVVLLTRNQRQEFLWVKRPLERSFMGGYFALIGGAIEEEDSCQVHAMTRELFEETGLLVTHHGDLQHEGFSERKAVKCTRKLDALFSKNETHIAHQRFRTICNWKAGNEYSKPPYVCVFELEVEDGVLEEPLVYIDEEATHAEWISFSLAEKKLGEGRIVASALLRAIVDQFSKGIFSFEQETLLGQLNTYKIHEGIYSIPMKSPTLPPATTTNCVIVCSSDKKEFIVIDPGGIDSVEQKRLCGFVEALIFDGVAFKGIVLTHHHHDHLGAVDVLQASFQRPIFGHKKLGERSALIVNSPTKANIIKGCQIVNTPGHCDDHIAFFISRSRTLIAGDMVASMGSILVTPDHGHMGDYLKSLHLLLSLNATTMIPSHGCIIADPEKHLRACIAHREERHQSVLNFVNIHTSARAQDIVPSLYKDLPKSYWPLANLSVQSHLLWLAECQEIDREDDTFHAKK